MANAPVFITGVYRSGTTLTAQIINTHEKFSVVADTLHFFRFYLGRYAPVQERYAEIVDEAATRLKQRWRTDVPTDRIIERLESKRPVEMEDVYNAIMVETFCGGSSDIRWGEKTLLQWTNIPLFLQMFPDSQAIHILRDPRDVLASFREMTYETPDRYLDAVFCCLHSMQWAATIGEDLPKNRYFVVKHEDIKMDPAKSARQICDFLNVEYDPRMIDLANAPGLMGNPTVNDSSFGYMPKEITPVTVGRWRSNLQGFEVMFVESIIKDLLPRFGYEYSDCKFNINDIRTMWNSIRKTPLLQQRMSRWLETGEGVESYPSDPTDNANWEEVAMADSPRPSNPNTPKSS